MKSLHLFCQPDFSQVIYNLKKKMLKKNRCLCQFMSLFPFTGWYHVGIKLFICSDKKGGEAFINSHIKSVLTYSQPDLFFALKENVHYLAVAVIANDFSVISYGFDEIQNVC